MNSYYVKKLLFGGGDLIGKNWGGIVVFGNFCLLKNVSSPFALHGAPILPTRGIEHLDSIYR